MIPVVDFKDCAVSISNDELGERHIFSIAKEICDAFKTVGFVYLKNHGISAEKVNCFTARMLLVRMLYITKHYRGNKQILNCEGVGSLGWQGLL